MPMTNKWLIAVCLCLFAIPGSAWCETAQLEAGSPWPHIMLPVPADAVQRHYLGVKSGSIFAVGDISAEIVIVQIFSMYCPVCQREAPRVNQFYALVDKDESMRRRLKIIGIGAGNSSFEVDFYRRNYQIPFPLFADGEFTIHKKVGEVRTPHFFILNKDAQGGLRIAGVHAGGFKTPAAFLEEILEKCASSSK